MLDRRVSLIALAMISVGSANPAWAEDGPDDSQDEAVRTVVVTGERSQGYAVDVSATALRLDARPIETPVSVSIVTDQLLADRGITNLNAAGDTVAGVQRQSGYGYPFTTSYVIRGFRTDGAASTLNGYREFGFVTARDPINIARVEFLKGPASVLYGSSFALGGVVNYVTKTPARDSFVDAGVQVGSIGLRRATLDANLAGEGGRSGLRVTGAIGEEGLLQAFRPKSYRFGSAVGTLQLTDSLSLLAEAYVFDGKTAGRDGDGLYPTPEVLALPRNFKPGERFSRGTQDSWGGRVEAEWAVAADASLRGGLFYNKASQDYFGTRPDFSNPVSADGLFLNRSASRGEDRQQDLTALAELRARVELFGVTHRVLLGASFSDYDFGPYQFFSAPFEPLSLANPVYGLQPPPASAFVLDYPAQSYGAEALAFYAQDFIEVGERVRLLAGLRYDRVKSRYEDVEQVFNRQTEGAWSPRFGVVFLPVPQLSLYASWSRSFVPNSFGRSADGSLFAPERGEQWEAGAKAELLDGRVSATASVFELTRRNILISDPADPNFSIPVGAQRSRGVEFEMQGRIAKGWQLTAAYTLTNAKVSRDGDPDLLGDRLPLAAKHSGSIWTRYDHPVSPDLTAGIGGGVFASSRRQASLPNTALTLPGYARLDMALFLAWRERVRLQVNVDNLTDERILDSGGFFIAPQPGRTVRASVTVSL
jgi:iron complex outermembrane receptor protein